jgi:hypothetical protein
MKTCETLVERDNIELSDNLLGAIAPTKSKAYEQCFAPQAFEDCDGVRDARPMARFALDVHSNRPQTQSGDRVPIELSANK